jgi:ferredoxin-type protein NapG
MENGRRTFILGTIRAVGVTALGGLIWSAYINEAKANTLILRPPGALKESDFLSTCIKCGMCVEACPYDTLSLAKPGNNVPLGTPFFTPREIPCYMCDDIPCVPVCPTNALDITKVSTNSKLDIDKAQMGAAIIDTKSCIAFWGIQCDACYRACPLMDSAIYLKYEQNNRTGKHAFLKPVVNTDICTGCGLCEHACVTKEAAIKVVPRKLALGVAGNNYIKSWDKKDEKKLENVKEIKTTTKISNKKAVDSLNDMGDLLDDL